jgi:NMD protein affecting ribosome stability and mRNA decay
VSVVIARFCQHCGVRPVSDWLGETRTSLCDQCLTHAVMQIVNNPEPFLCPGCGSEQDVPLDALFVCPACGWDEGREQ